MAKAFEYPARSTPLESYLYHPYQLRRTYAADYATLLLLVVILVVSEASTPFERFIYTADSNVRTCLLNAGQPLDGHTTYIMSHKRLSSILSI